MTLVSNEGGCVLGLVFSSSMEGCGSSIYFSLLGLRALLFPFVIVLRILFGGVYPKIRGLHTNN
jgi:urea transporter